MTLNRPLILPGSPWAAPVEKAALSFTGESGDFFHLAARGAALQLVTFGFYRFWLVTDIRRHLWSHTRLDGDGFEYTGRGRELLIGFLFALAILTPVYLLYFLAGLEAERLKAFTSIPLFLFFYLFQQFAVFRARRYRLTRTTWRGVRFWMSGSGWSYAGRSFGWMALVVLTLGLLYPWRAAALERYKMRHTHYGDLQGRFDATGGQLFARIWPLWLIAASPLVVLVAAAASQGFSAMSFSKKSAEVASAAIGLAVLALPILWPLFRALEWRWWVGGVRFGDVSARSALRKRDVLKLYLKFAGALALIGVVLSGIAALILAGAPATLWSLPGSVVAERAGPAGAVLSISAILVYLCIGLAVGVVKRYFLQRGLWEAVVRTTSVEGVGALASVAARGDAANALGEGLADGLDVAGF